MGDLDGDTNVTLVEGEDGSSSRFRAELSPDWEIWGPNGGYLTAVMLRAAGAHSRFARPATLTCHFLGVAAFGEIEIDVDTVRAGRTAESLRVMLRQADRAIADAMLWSVPDGLAGLEHDAAPLPDVPQPDAIRPAPLTGFPFWANLDRRPVGLASKEEWLQREPGEPVEAGWYRFLPVSAFDDPWLEAGRLAILLDTLNWPAATLAYREEDLRFFAPSLDVSVQFHHMPQGAEWLFVEATAPVAADGLVGSLGQLWADDGRLLATARQQMLCRPVAAPQS